MGFVKDDLAKLVVETGTNIEGTTANTVDNDKAIDNHLKVVKAYDSHVEVMHKLEMDEKRMELEEAKRLDEVCDKAERAAIERQKIRTEAFVEVVKITGNIVATVTVGSVGCVTSAFLVDKIVSGEETAPVFSKALSFVQMPINFIKRFI